MSEAPKPMTARAAREALGVGALAGPGEIRRAFREAAKRAHPDRPGGSAEGFRTVVEAYRLLQRQPRREDLFVQPPARREAAPPELSIGPLVALAGGSVEQRLADGRVVRIRLPAGLRTGDTVRAGDTELPVVVRGEGDMLVRGDDLWLTVSVAPRILADGGRVALETPLGRRVVWITRKAAERGLVRLPGQGLPARGSHAQGHLFLRLTRQKSSTDSAARSLLRRFAAAWAA
ncbi:DnaJ domain-containing protein [Phenylobacterium sp.]|jgi:curved DNA-binding protein|uniref:DnaJ domain-containing protein n=1 Tax=Phenylobacterium sp. TaxID=1871053 RepID=UPI002F95CDB5